VEILGVISINKSYQLIIHNKLEQSIQLVNNVALNFIVVKAQVSELFLKKNEMNCDNLGHFEANNRGFTLGSKIISQYNHTAKLCIV
jgi:hypothetical protein